jgi:hypothetical protein
MGGGVNICTSILNIGANNLWRSSGEGKGGKSARRNYLLLILAAFSPLAMIEIMFDSILPAIFPDQTFSPSSNFNQCRYTTAIRAPIDKTAKNTYHSANPITTRGAGASPAERMTVFVIDPHT